MRLLRSEDEASGQGELMSVAQLEALARAWYGDRLDPDWRPRTRDQSQRLLADVGLTGGFWELP
jgi:hypothetical protein